MRQPATLVVGLYAWVVTVAFGAVLLDVVYAAQGSSVAGRIPAEAGDLLLGLVALTVLGAAGAIAATWGRRPAPYLVASLVVLVVALLTPTLLAGVVGDAEAALGIRLGPWLRLGEAGLASLLAFAGLWESWRNG